jgi:protein SERAC1
MLTKSIGLLKQTNQEILQVLQNDSEVLARIQDSFHTIVRAQNQDGTPPIEITCFYEELPLPGIGFVSTLVPCNLYNAFLSYAIISLLNMFCL